MNDMNTNKRSGFALSGALLNVTLGGLIVLGAGSVGIFNARNLASMASFPGLNSKDQSASSIIAQDIRSASSVESAGNDQIVLRVPGAEGASTVTYTYDANARTLTRANAGMTQTLLTEIDSFSFSFFQCPSPNAAYNSFAPAVPKSAKMVGCRWSCSKKVGGTSVDSENIQIAPTVLRGRC